MKRSVPILLSAVMMMLFLFGCGDDTPAPFQQYSSMLADGSNSVNRDNSLQVSSLGKAFYISDDIIFHLGDRLTRQSLNTGELIALSPTASLINDKRYLAIDRATQMLYFAADKAIYRAGFAGQGLTKLSPEGNGDYSAPALSSCGQYLTAIRDEHISRLNLSTLEWTDLTEPDSALYAVYASDENAYYYFFYDKGDGYTNNFVGLNKYDNSTQENTLLMIGNDLDPYSNHNTFEAQVSENHRYFAMQFVWETLEDVGMFGSTWLRFPDTLRLYDRLNGQLITIDSSFCYAFVGDGDTLLYSRWKYGMADLMRMDLPTQNSSMIWDGYYQKDYYSWSITQIFPRDDGMKIYIDAWKRSSVKIDNSKSPTAPL